LLDSVAERAQHLSYMQVRASDRKSMIDD